MIELQTRPHSLIENWHSIRGVLGATGTEALDEFRARNFRRFEDAGLPTTRDEEFKYFSIRDLVETRFEPAYGATVTRTEVERTALGSLDAITVAFVNGQHAPEFSTINALPAGAFI